MYRIKGKSKDVETLIAETYDIEEANILREEYQNVFGYNWGIVVESDEC